MAFFIRQYNFNSLCYTRVVSWISVGWSLFTISWKQAYCLCLWLVLRHWENFLKPPFFICKMKRVDYISYFRRIPFPFILVPCNFFLSFFFPHWKPTRTPVHQHQRTVGWLKFRVEGTQIGIPNIFFSFILLRYDLHAVKFTLYSVQFCKFWQLIKSCYSQDIEQFHHPKTFSLTPFWVSSSAEDQLLATTGLFYVSLVFHFPHCHVNGFIQYLPFWVWVLLLSIMHLKFIHVVCILNSSYECTI